MKKLDIKRIIYTKAVFDKRAIIGKTINDILLAYLVFKTLVIYINEDDEVSL